MAFLYNVKQLWNWIASQPKFELQDI